MEPIVKFIDLPAQYEAARSLFMDVKPEDYLAQGQYIGGEPVRAFEECFAEYCGVKHAIGCSSGTDALTACFETVAAFYGGMEKSILVVTQANTFVATANAALRIPRATVTFVDCDEHFQMDLDELETMLPLATTHYNLVIVVPVHMYGIMADMPRLMEIAKEYSNVRVVEDASHAHGSICTWGRAGSYGHMSAFSCYPAKPLGAVGDAGVITTEMDDYADYARSYCNCGRGADWDMYDKVGYTHRLDTIQAVVLDAKLNLLDSWRDARSKVAEGYSHALFRVENLAAPRIPEYQVGVAWYAYPILLSTGTEMINLMERLKTVGVPTKRYYSQIIPDSSGHRYHPQVVLQLSGRRARDYASRLLCLPIHEFMSLLELDCTIRQVVVQLDRIRRHSP
jgi:dTDP-4-amino-4,6-dideoxygalactose transaminase